MISTQEDNKMPYDFDPLGVIPGNKIPNELHTITAINGTQYNYLIPDAAPFFASSMVVVDAESGMPISEGSDFFFAYPFEEASIETGFPIYGAIGFYNLAATGSYRLVYRTLGGDYVNAMTTALADGLSTLGELINTPWSSLTDIPATFPPTPHNTPLTTITGVPEILAAFETLSLAVRSPDRHITMSDIVDLDTTLVAPIVDSMKNVSLAIGQLAAATAFYHTGGSTGTVLKQLPLVTMNEWVDVGVSVLVKYTGNYLVFLSGNPRALLNGVRQHYEFRYLIDGYAVSASTLGVSPVGITAGRVITMQIRIPDATVESIVVADINVSCALTLLKVSD